MSGFDFACDRLLTVERLLLKPRADADPGEAGPSAWACTVICRMMLRALGPISSATNLCETKESSGKDGNRWAAALQLRAALLGLDVGRELEDASA
mmetsp:Transcript_53340/g.155433  ORF Transcript_53340/g.155433 Transcript_53340/m.155433 type:complete len:96 (+) Transcript_53340:821-1108(+)